MKTTHHLHTPRHAARTVGMEGDSLKCCFQEHCFVVSRLSYPKLSQQDLLVYSKLLHAARNDKNLFLHSFSTSPLHESERFVTDMQGMLEFLLRNGKNGFEFKEEKYKWVEGEQEWEVIV